MDLGDKIKKARIESGKSQDELADAIGVTRATISRWERGMTSPTLRDIRKLDEIINLDFFDKTTDITSNEIDGSNLVSTIEDLSHSIEDIRLDLINLEKSRRSTRKTVIAAIIISVILTLAVVFAVIIFFNWPASKDDQPLKIEYLNEPISQTTGGANG